MFTQTDIQIIPAPPAPTREGEAVIVRPTRNYSVEVRSAEALRLEYIHTLNTLTDTTGVMITLTQPAMRGLPYMKVLTPVDVLFVNANGTIVQILPGAVLGNISQVIAASEPISAFLFLKNGQAAAQSIHPRDTVSGPMFTAAPAVIR